MVALREAVNKSENGEVYLGHFPKANVPGLPDGMPVSCSWNNHVHRLLTEKVQDIK